MEKIIKAIGYFLLDTIEVFALAAAFFALMYIFVAQPHNVDGSSMEPNLHHGQYLLTNKFIYKFKPFQRGDIVIFKYPNNLKEHFIKRVIGLPEESFKIEDGKITIYNNNNPTGIVLEEPYLPKGETTLWGKAFPEGIKVAIPEDKLLVLGDNRHHSSDSREWGLISFDLVIGKAWFSYYPVKSFGKIQNPEYPQNI